MSKLRKFQKSRERERERESLTVLAVFVSLILLTLFTHFTPAEAQTASWYSDAWQYRVKITVDSTKVDENLTDFPVYIDLSDLPASFFTSVQPDGGDVRITLADGTTEVPREVVSISTASSTGELHFKASSLSSTTDFGFYIYYGNSGATEPAASATYGSQNVWTNNYAAVYHMGEGNAVDSTGNGNDGTNFGTTNATGQMGNARDFNNHRIEIPSTVLNGLTDVTTSFWFSTTRTAQFSILSGLGTSLPNEYLMYFANSTSFVPYIHNGSVTFNIPSIATGLYRSFHVVGDDVANTTELYIDGTSQGAKADPQSALDIIDRILLGQNHDSAGSNGNAGQNFVGQLDEVRVASTTRSANWISTEYNNQSSPSTFYAVSAPEQQPSIPDTTGEMSSANYRIIRSSINIGGTENSTSANFILNDTIGQFASGYATSTNYDITAGYRHMSTSTAISISVSTSSDVILTTLSGIQAGSSVATTAWTVTTDNPAGYSLSVKASTSPALQTESGDSFADYATSSTPDFIFTIAATTSAFGFTPEGADITGFFKDNGSACNTGTSDTAAACWVGFTTTDRVVSQTASATDANGATTTLRVKTEIGANHHQTPGAYTATITATALAL